MRIGARQIGPGLPPYVIAELGVNHDGDPERALRLARLAADAGADAIKLQWFNAERLMGARSRLAEYQREAGERDPLAMLRRLELRPDAMARVVELAHARGVHAIVTVFSVELVLEADRLPWDAYKSASPDIVHRPLLEAMARTGRPLLVSTGASTLGEVEHAAGWLGERPAGFLHCVSCYPTAPRDASLFAIPAIARALPGRVVGYSDHTTRLDTGELASRCGACVLEKHFTDDPARPGPDHAASLDPSGFAEYARRARAVVVPEAERVDPGLLAERIDPELLGEPEKHVRECERDVREVSRQSITAARDLEPGRVLTRDDLCFKRPGVGLLPFELERVLGRTLRRGVRADHPLTPADLG